jgi:hypothetical protein
VSKLSCISQLDFSWNRVSRDNIIISLKLLYQQVTYHIIYGPIIATYWVLFLKHQPTNFRIPAFEVPVKGIKSSRAMRCVKCPHKTDVSRTISVPIIRDLICQRSFRCLYKPHLTRLIAQEDFIELYIENTDHTIGSYVSNYVQQWWPGVIFLNICHVHY